MKKLIELNDEEFDQFSATHPLTSFHQTAEWGKLKTVNNWSYVCLGFKEDGQIIAATLLLSRPVLGRQRVFYAPRGFLINFNDFTLLQTFTAELKQYVQAHHGILLKIDPYLSYQQRDNNGEVVKDGANNFVVHQNLLKLGFKHHGFSLHQEDLQPRWIFTVDTKDQTLEAVRHHFASKTRQKINGNEKLCISTREIGRDELPKYKAVMASTAKRRGFIDRPLSYYQRMYDAFHAKGWIKFTLTELDVKQLKATYENEIKDLQTKIQARETQFTTGKQKMNPASYEEKQALDRQNLEKAKAKLRDLETTFSHDVEVLGGVLFFTFGREVLSLFGGAYDQHADFQSAYTTHYYGLKYAVEHGYDRYNFYGIEGVFDPKHPMYGIYQFKRGYGGEVVELLGEYDLPVRKCWTFAYNGAFGLYHGLKKIKVKLTPKH